MSEQSDSTAWYIFAKNPQYCLTPGIRPIQGLGSVIFRVIGKERAERVVKYYRDFYDNDFDNEYAGLDVELVSAADLDHQAYYRIASQLSEAEWVARNYGSEECWLTGDPIAEKIMGCWYGLFNVESELKQTEDLQRQDLAKDVENRSRFTDQRADMAKEVEDWLWRLECLDKELARLIPASDIHALLTCGSSDFDLDARLAKGIEDSPLGEILFAIVGGNHQIRTTNWEIFGELPKDRYPFGIDLGPVLLSCRNFETRKKVIAPTQQNKLSMNGLWLFRESYLPDDSDVHSTRYLSSLFSAIECLGPVPEAVTRELGFLSDRLSASDNCSWLPWLIGAADNLKHPLLYSKLVLPSSEFKDEYWSRLVPDIRTATTYALESLRRITENKNVDSVQPAQAQEGDKAKPSSSEQEAGSQTSDTPDAKGFVRNPSDEAAYVGASEITKKHWPVPPLPEVSNKDKKLNKILDGHPEIWRWKPYPNRLSVHLGLWLKYVEGQKETVSQGLAAVAQKGLWTCRDCRAFFVNNPNSANCPECKSNDITPVIPRLPK